MAVFQNRKYRAAGASSTIGARYRAMMAKRPFLLFGLPFMSIIVAASFVLTPATAIRYERHDRKVRQMTREEELGVGKSGRKVDIREEYYVRSYLLGAFFFVLLSYYTVILHSDWFADALWLRDRGWPRRILIAGSRSGSRG